MGDTVMTDAVIEKPTGAEDVVWDLSPLYAGADDPAIARDMERFRQTADAWAGEYRGRVATLNAEQVATALREYEALMEDYVKLASFVNLTFTTDTNNPTYGALLQKISEFDAEIQQKLLFFDLEWNALDDEAARKIIDDPAIGKYRHYLEAERRYKPYRLSEIEEQLLVEKDVTGREAWIRLFTQLMGAARYEFDGQQLTQSQILAKLHEQDRDVRRRAADSITATLRDKAMELTYIFNVLVADKAADDRRRGYPSWISARNLSNQASDAIVEALVTAVTSNYDIVARHYDLKRRIMGLDKLEDYDRYAPLNFDAAEREYTWAEAREIVQDAYDAFSPEMGAIARRFFDENWIHAALAPGKRSGAFASPVVPSAHPYILMNFTGKGRDVKTLAHEMGHGVHMALSARQGFIGAYTPLTTAEMASVFGEQMVFDDLMKKEPDPAARLAMLTGMIEDMFATVFRQVSMNRFEDLLHNARRTRGELTSADINALWMESQRAMFGDSVDLRDEYGLWWSYVPHFIHTPGYVYAYAFGQLLVMALYQLYQDRGADFVPQYLDVLAAGGSDYPENILAKVGVDLADPNFWAQGLEAIRSLVAQEEELARQVFPDKF
jgi:oligoendopeptidase F